MEKKEKKDFKIFISLPFTGVEDTLAERFEDAVIKFLCQIRRNNNKAKIIWAYGMLGTPMMEYIYRAVYVYKNEFGDKNVFITQLPNTTEETVGARLHPGILNHKAASDHLVNFIRNL